MTIKNGQPTNANDVIKSIGVTAGQLAYFGVKSDASNWTNGNFLGADIFTDSNGAKNTIDTAESSASYNSSGKYYELPNFDDIDYYVIIEADSYSGNANNITQFASGKWLVYDDTYDANIEVQRAKVWETLLYDEELTNFSNISAVKVSDSNDVGFRGYKITFSASTSVGNSKYVTLTFSNTTDNYVSSWSNLSVSSSNWNDVGSEYLRWECPAGTTLNQASKSTQTSNEIGTDRSSDEKTNPSNARINQYSSGTATMNGSAKVIFLCKSEISDSSSGSPTYNITDYYTDHSIPNTTQADTLANEGVIGGNFSVTTNTILNDVTPKSIVVYGKAEIPTDTDITIDVSDDGGSNWDITNQSVNYISDSNSFYSVIDTTTLSGSDLALKFNLSSTDTSKTPKFYGYSVVITDS